MHITENKVSSKRNTRNSNVSGNPPFFQPKLTINAPGDEYEQEADAMADKVMRMPINEQHFFSPKPLSISRLQRKCAACENEEKLQGKEKNESHAGIAVQRKCKACEEEEKKIHRKESANATTPTVTPAVEQTLQSSGQPLDKSTRSFMEQRFGYDFSNVQIHNDSLAHKSAADINAAAYTNSNHVVFSAGQFQPETDSGKQLLAHELVHVVQQRKQSTYTSTPLFLQRRPKGTKPKKKFSPGDFVRVTPSLLTLTTVPCIKLPCEDDPHYKKVETVKQNTLLKVVMLWPGTDNLDRTDGVYQFIIMSDYNKIKPDESGGELKGVADSSYVEPSPASTSHDYVETKEESSKGTIPKERIPKESIPDCNKRHEDYCAAQKRYPENTWLSCVCKVSNDICLNIDTLRSRISRPVEVIIAGEKADWFNNMGTCMHRKWKAAIEGFVTGKPQPGATQEWSKAIEICANKGINTKECCDAQVEGEQSGFTNCLGEAGKYNNDAWKQPGWILTPSELSGKDFNDQETRFKYGKNACCPASDFVPGKTVKGTIETPQFAGTQPRIVDVSSGYVKIEGEKYTIPVYLFCSSWYPGNPGNPKTTSANDIYKAAWEKICKEYKDK